MAFSTKKVQQRTRRQRQVAAATAARRSFAAAHPSILRNTRHDRNNIHNVSFSATCTAKFFVEESPSIDVSCPSRVEREERMLPHVEEAVQPEGETDWRGVLAAIEAAVKILPVPVIVKEVGAGIQAPLVVRLFDVGVSSVDVAGLGGTNWARIEAARRPDGSVAAFEPFLDWGIPTLECLLQAAQVCPDKSLIASGGVRHGLDAAKALWAGASMVSLAGPMLKALSGTQSGILEPERLAAMIDDWCGQMALAFFLTGSADIAAFRRCAAVVNTPGQS